LEKVVEGEDWAKNPEGHEFTHDELLDDDVNKIKLGRQLKQFELL
jgi:hypothetical protein